MFDIRLQETVVYTQSNSAAAAAIQQHFPWPFLELIINRSAHSLRTSHYILSNTISFRGGMMISEFL